MNDMTLASSGPMIALPDGPDLETLFRTKGGLAPFVAEIKKRCETEVFDVSTASGRKAARSLAYRVAQSKTLIEGKAKEINADMTAAIAAVNAEKRSAMDVLEKLQADIKRPAEEWEAKEELRKQAHMANLQAIASPGLGIKSSAASIRERLGVLEGLVIDESWQEFEDAGKTRLGEELERLRAFLEVAEAWDEAERLRQEREAREAAEWAARQEEERRERALAQKRAEEERQAREAAEAEAELLRRQAAERDAELEAMREKLAAADRERAEAEAHAKAQAELEAAAREVAAMEAEAAAVRAEEERLAQEAAEAAAQARRGEEAAAQAAREREAQETAERRLAEVRDEIRTAFVHLSSAKGLIHYDKVVDAIFDQTIPHLTVSFAV